MNKQKMKNDEALELDFYLRWTWPEHIERSLRSTLWISLVEVSEVAVCVTRHTTNLRWLIATYPQAPSTVLGFLAELDEPLLLTRVAENPQTSKATLAHLARSKYSQVKIAVAENDNTAGEILVLLATDHCVDVRFSMAQNPSLPSKMLHQLSLDENPYVADRATRMLARLAPTFIRHFSVRKHASA